MVDAVDVIFNNSATDLSSEEVQSALVEILTRYTSFVNIINTTLSKTQALLKGSGVPTFPAPRGTQYINTDNGVRYEQTSLTPTTPDWDKSGDVVSQALNLSEIPFEAGSSGLTSTNLNDAIFEIFEITENLEAVNISYDNTDSAMAAENIKAAIDELKTEINNFSGMGGAVDIDYNNIGSGLTATDVQAAIDEIKSLFDTFASDVDAIDIDYNNATSGFASDNLQAVIDEIDSIIDTLVTSLNNLSATDVDYDNIISGLAATNVKNAIDELKSISDNLTSLDIEYDNTISGLLATNVKFAVDEVVDLIDTLDGLDIGYDNTTSLLIADNLQDAVDELKGIVDDISSLVDWDATPSVSDPSLVSGFGIDYDDVTKLVTFNDTGLYLGDSQLGAGVSAYMSSAILDSNVSIEDALAKQFSIDTILDTSGSHMLMGAFWVSNNVSTGAGILDYTMAALGAPSTFPTDSAGFGSAFNASQNAISSSIAGDSGAASPMGVGTVTGFTLADIVMKLSFGSDGTNVATVSDISDGVNYNQTYLNEAKSVFSANFSGTFNLVLISLHQVADNGNAKYSLANEVGSNFPAAALGGGDGFTLTTTATDTSVSYDATAFYSGASQSSNASTTGGSQVNYDTYINDDGYLEGISSTTYPALPADKLIRAIGTGLPYDKYGTTIKNDTIYYNNGSTLKDLTRQPVETDQTLNTTDDVVFNTVDANYFKSEPNLVDAAGFSGDGVATAQADATVLTSGVNILNSISFGNDGLRLPEASADLVGAVVEVSTTSIQLLYIYPASGETIDLVGSVDNPLVVSGNSPYHNRYIFRCVSVGNWSIIRNQSLLEQSDAKFNDIDVNDVDANKVHSDTVLTAPNVIAGVQSAAGSIGDGFILNTLSQNAAITTGTESQGDNPITRAVTNYTNITSVRAATLPNIATKMSYVGVPMGGTITVANNGAWSFLLYPDTGHEIDDLGTNIPMTINVGESYNFTVIGGSSWRSSKNYKKGEINSEVYANVYVDSGATSLQDIMDDNSDTPKIYFLNPPSSATYSITGNSNSFDTGDILIGNGIATIVDADAQTGQIKFDSVQNVTFRLSGDSGAYGVRVQEFKNCNIVISSGYTSLIESPYASILGYSNDNPFATNCTFSTVYATAKIPDGVKLYGTTQLSASGSGKYAIDSNTTINVYGDITIDSDVLSGSSNLIVNIFGGDSSGISLTQTGFTGNIIIREINQGLSTTDDVTFNSVNAGTLSATGGTPNLDNIKRPVGLITPSATQDQTDGTEISNYFSQVNGGSSNGDSIKLPEVGADSSEYIVWNPTAYEIQVFPDTTEEIDDLGLNNSITLNPDDIMIFRKIGNSKWKSSQSLSPTSNAILNNLTVNGTLTVGGSSVVKETDTSVASMQFVIDEDDMVSNSDTKVPTQQSVKAYVDDATLALTMDTTIRTASFTAVAGNRYYFDFSPAGATLTLPLTPTVGDTVEFKDINGTLDVGVVDLTLGRNGESIMSAAADYTLSEAYALYRAKFVGGTIGWAVYVVSEAKPLPFTQAYGGWFQFPYIQKTTTVAALNTTYNINVDVIVQSDDSSGVTAVAGGGLRNTSGEGGWFIYTCNTEWWSNSRLYYTGCRVRQTDDTTYDAMIKSSYPFVFASSAPTSPSWSCMVYVAPNETVFPCVEQTESTANNIVTRGISASMRRVA